MLCFIQLECCGVDSADDWKTSWWHNNTLLANQNQSQVGSVLQLLTKITLHRQTRGELRRVVVNDDG